MEKRGMIFTTDELAVFVCLVIAFATMVWVAR